MSFRRLGGPAPPKKGASRRRPGWDDSVNDLTVYRATPAEIMMRKESYKSNNHMSVKLEKMRKEREKLSGAELQQLNIMKEVLYDQKQLQRIVAKSDKMMAVVKDLFGDDPKRFTGFPNVTTAPQSSSASSSLVRPVPDIYTRTEKLSDSVMNMSALNDVEIVNVSDSDEEDDEDDTDQPEPISYESKLNLLKFQQFLQEEEQSLQHQDPPTLIAQQNQNQSNGILTNGNSRPAEQMPTLPPNANLPPNVMHAISKALLEKESELKEGLLSKDPQVLKSLLAAFADETRSSTATSNGFKTPPKSQQGNPRLASAATPPSAINDTKKVKKTRKRSDHPSVQGETTNTSMSDMRKVLQDLEKELGEYEHQVGRGPHEEKDRSETFSGYTVALVNSVSRLTRYLKETELRLKTETTLREQLTEDVFQLRTIIDALATDIIMTQEEYAKLFTENQQYRDTTNKIIVSLQNEMQEMRTLISGQTPRSAPSENGPETQSRVEDAVEINKSQTKNSRTSTPTGGEQGREQTNLPPERNQYRVPEASRRNAGMPGTAIMLSPPVQKTRVARDKDARKIKNIHDIAPTTTQVQVPSVIESISVPRPIPLVQSNLPVDLTSMTTSGSAEVPTSSNARVVDLQNLVKFGDQTREQLNNLHKMAVEEALENPELQDLMQTQIQELNRQQEEARKRLHDLLSNQKVQQQHLQAQLGPNVFLDGDFSPLNGNYSQMSMPQNPVSPPISPISEGFDKPAFRDEIFQVTKGRGITLSLPTVDLDVSTGSLASSPLDPIIMKTVH